MGNQESWCDQFSNNANNEHHQKNALRYGALIHDHDAVNTFSRSYAHQSKNQLDEIRSNENIFSKNHQSKLLAPINKQAIIFRQNTSSLSEKQLYGKTSRFSKPNERDSRQFQGNQSISSQSGSKNSNHIKKSRIFGHSNSKSYGNKQFQQEQIDIEYLPTVRKLIEREKPFSQEFVSINQQTVKKIRINNGKDIYKGSLDSNGKPKGYGIIIKQNGSVLIGNFRNGFIDGQAFFIFNNGSYYKGKMILNQSHDYQGEFHSKKFSYKGGFENNHFHGDCIQMGDDYVFKGIYENNTRKKGIFQWGLKSSSRIQRNKNSHLVPERNIHQFNSQLINQQNPEHDEQLPPMRNFESINQYKYKYDGGFDKNQLFAGHGKLSDPQGTYIGQFLNGKKHGKGEYLYASKIKYSGSYANDEKNGEGILYNYDDTKAYEGTWQNGLPDGKGFSFDLDGRRTEGEFVKGINTRILPESEVYQSKIKSHETNFR